MLLNKNMVVVFNLTMFGGIRDALCIGNVCPDFIVAVYSNISGGPRVGPNLIAHVSSIYKWCVQWLAWGSRCCCFRGGGLSKGFRFLVAWVRLLLERRFGCVLMVPKDHLGDRLPAGTTSPVRWGARWWRARFSLPWCESLYDSESTYVVVQGGSIFSVCHVDVLYRISDYKPRMWTSF